MEQTDNPQLGFWAVRTTHVRQCPCVGSAAFSAAVLCSLPTLWETDVSTHCIGTLTTLYKRILSHTLFFSPSQTRLPVKQDSPT